MSGFTNTTDEEIVEQVRSSNKELFAELIRRYETKLLRYATYLIVDEAMAADAVQAGFIKVFVNLHGFNTKRKFSSWIYRIVHNEAMSLIRKHKLTSSVDEVLEAASGPSLEDTLVQRELLEHMQHCLGQMSLMYREPLTLYFLEEKSYEEISDILRLPVATVGTRISRAKIIAKKICQKKH
jgi:RNA polymerase sigma-70 factor (ECF subfamily)